MTIKVGDRFPSVTLKYLGKEGMAEITTDDLLKGKTVALFAVPGAFTPTCSAKHLPSFTGNAEALKAKGVDKIVCLSVNDPFVMKAWADKNEVSSDTVFMLPDGNAALTKELGLEMDGSGYGLGTRSLRFALIAKDGVVTHLGVEKPGAFEVSSGEAILAAL